jgi:hypothetical protein
MRLRSTLLPALVGVLTLAACGSSGTRTVVVTRVERTATPTTTETYTGAVSTGTQETGAVSTGTQETTPTAGTGTVTTASGYLGTVPTSTVDKVAALNAITSKAKAIVHLTTFRSPTGNIGCVILDRTARCDISQRSWKPPPRPASCSREVDFGQGLEVGGSGKGSFVCAGDTALDPTGTPLSYGDASIEGDLACVSAFTGMTCSDLTDRHGFFISRERYRIF